MNQPNKPALVQAIAIMTLVSGILNILASLSITTSLVLGTLGLGLLCTPITILPLVLGVFEIIYATKLLANPPKSTKPNPTIAFLEIACIIIGNVISMAIGILALVFYNDEEVRAYFESINP